MKNSHLFVKSIYVTFLGSNTDHILSFNLEPVLKNYKDNNITSLKNNITSLKMEINILSLS